MKGEMNQEDRKSWARTLFTTGNKEAKDVALEVGVSESVIKGWIKNGAWDEVRSSGLVSKKQQAKMFMSQIEKLNNRLANENDPNPKDVDLIVKYTNAVKNLEEEIALATIIDVSEQFIIWLRNRDSAMAKKLVVLFDSYIKVKVKG